MRHAREMLGRTDRGPSVRETAAACGFTNLGHFASDYFKRFGERPSETLKRSRGDLALPNSTGPMFPNVRHWYGTDKVSPKAGV
jgi:AraC-like DNA-binding protein